MGAERMIRSIFSLILASFLLAGVPVYAAVTPAQDDIESEKAEIRDPVTILISIDGFRPDYLERGITPNLGSDRHLRSDAPVLPEQDLPQPLDPGDR